MNNKDQENGALREPLIFTVTDYGFVMALYLDSLGRSNPTAFCAKTFSQEAEPIEPKDSSRRSREVKNLILFSTKQFNQTAGAS
jgi:hypothetical protein